MYFGDETVFFYVCRCIYLCNNLTLLQPLVMHCGIKYTVVFIKARDRYDRLFWHKAPR